MTVYFIAPSAATGHNAPVFSKLSPQAEYDGSDLVFDRFNEHRFYQVTDAFAMTSIYVAFWIGILVVILIYLAKFGLSHLYDYRVGQYGIEFTLLRFIPVFTIEFGAIESAREIRIFTAIDDRPSSMFTSLVVGNRISAGLIVLKMRAGLFRYVALTPANRKVFLHNVVAHLSTREPASVRRAR